MANGKPTALKLLFLRGTRVRKEEIPGEPAGDVNDLMKIIPRGARAAIRYQAARDLIIGESAIEDNAANRERIAELETELIEANKRDAARIAEKSKLSNLKKAA